jgi:uncharacterized protein
MLLFPQKRAILALLLISPVFAIGTVLSLVIAPGTLGSLGFVIAYLCFITFPVLWTIKIDQDFIQFPKITKQGWMTGLGLGVVMATAILAAYFFVGQHWVNLAVIRAKMQTTGGTNPIQFWISSFYFTFINALIEEAVWRGFVYRKCAILIRGMGAVFLSALLFTIHHTIGMAAITQDWRITLVGTIGVFAAGVTWASSYRSTRSLWPCYVSHVLADVAIAIVNWHLLFRP